MEGSFPLKPILSLSIHAEIDSVPVIREWLEALAHEEGLPDNLISHLVLAVEEAVDNIILHAYGEAGGEIELEAERQGEALIIRIMDRGTVFNPLDCPEPDLRLPLEARPQGSMGIPLMKRFVDEIRHRARPGGGNELELILKI